MPASKSSRILVFTLLVCTQPLLTSTKACYYPDSSYAEGFLTCNGNYSVSHCCRPGDACLSTNLCYQAGDASINTGACTDSTWADGRCFQHCPGTYKQSNVNVLYRCSDNEWCCSSGGNVTSCCNDLDVSVFNIYQSNITNGSAWGSSLSLLPVAQIQTTNKYLSNITNGSAWGSSLTLLPVAQFQTTKTDTSSFPAASGNDSSPTTTSSSCPSTAIKAEGRKIGLTVGVAIGIPLFEALAGTCVLLWKERRANRELRSRTEGRSQQYALEKYAINNGRNGGYAHETTANVDLVEMPGSGELREMDGSAERSEMAAST